MNCKCIFTIFKSIINFNYFTWQFIWLSNRSKTNLKRISYWTTYDKSSCFWSNDDFCTLFFGKFNNLIHRIFKRSEEHTSELQSRFDLVCRLLLEKKNQNFSKR